jgi:hypothetical protein
MGEGIYLRSIQEGREDKLSSRVVSKVLYGRGWKREVNTYLCPEGL